MALEDADMILELVRTNYRLAFTDLYREFYKMAEYFIVKNSGNAADAEDIFQETMLVIYHKSRDASFRLTCDIKTYIYSIVRNLWLKELKKRKQRNTVRDYENYVSVTDDAEDAVNDEKTFEQLQAAILLLGDKCRRILQLFYFEKKSMDVIAAELDYTNADNAKNQKYKCLQQLKSNFSKEHG